MAKISKFDDVEYNLDGWLKRLEQMKKTYKLGDLSYSEKILYSHLVEDETKEFTKGKSYMKLNTDRVAMQDATGQMAILQFMSSGMKKVAVPSSVHADHLITASSSSEKDLEDACVTNKEVYDFLESASNKYGIDYWVPGCGIIHQIVLENYAFPFGVMIGTDSHTPNAGGLGMIAVGGGGADAVDVMAGLPLEIKTPLIMGVKLTGKLQGFARPKDIILRLTGLLTVKGGTNYALEYFGEGIESLSCSGMASICNMGAEVGATFSVFPYTKAMSEYLRQTQRSDIADVCDKYKDSLRADSDKVYDKIIEINLDELVPQLNGPFTPDLNTPVTEMSSALEKNGWPADVSVALIGSCTNSGYEDLLRSANICKQALEHGVKMKSKFYVTPGSELIHATIERDGIAKIFRDVGGTILANACGPCIGMWNRKDVEAPTKNTIVHSYNRNFKNRADNNPNTLAFIASPEMVTMLGLTGKLGFNPMTDMCIGEDGKQFKFTPPEGQYFPKAGFVFSDEGRIKPAEDGSKIEVKIPKVSDRLCLLEPFEPYDGTVPTNLPILIKVAGKCTTDHISAAGKWLKYRGHIDNISNNLLIGATNAENDKVNCVKDQLSGKEDEVPNVARHYKKEGIKWIVIGDTNYGEGSSREHAAIEPRYLGGFAIIARSFARIHEGNLKKQGLLALTFANPDDYDKISGDDRVSFPDIKEFAEGVAMKMVVKSVKNGDEFTVILNHTFTTEQIEWFKGGSALNVLAAKNRS